MEPDDHEPIPFVVPKEGTSRAVDCRPGAYRQGCEHRSVYVDVKARSLECKACGGVVDPFDHVVTIMDYGLGLDAEIYHLKQIRDQIATRDADKQQTCRHRHGGTDAQGVFRCPSCGLRRLPAISPHTHPSNPAALEGSGKNQ